MISNFIIEESYTRFASVFNELYSNKKPKINIIELLNECENKIIHNKRQLYVIEFDGNFMNTIEIKNGNINFKSVSFK